MKCGGSGATDGVEEKGHGSKGCSFEFLFAYYFYRSSILIMLLKGIHFTYTNVGKGKNSRIVIFK